MAGVEYKAGMPVGRKISKIRKLRGWTQDELATRLGTTRQAISKLENSFEIEPAVLKDICSKLDVTVEGLKSLDEDSSIYLTANYYDNCTITSSAGNAPYSSFHSNSLEDISKFYEKEFRRIRKEFEEKLGEVEKTKK